MVKDRKIKNIYTGTDASVTYDEVSICPCCKATLVPANLSAFVHKNKDANLHLTVIDYCKKCDNVFITKHELRNNRYSSGNPIEDSYYSYKVEYSEPSRFQQIQFEKNINDLSPQFVKIYNQALAAESYALDEIAGLGYRKALEFLIKDYSIYEFPSDETIIKSMPLSQCIKKYIDDTRIKTLAERSVWIGNDEAHYIRKQTDKDVTDMKAFIKATLYFISMVLITKDAESMSPK